MKQEIKRRLDGLTELLNEGYITEAEYAVARENIFLDAGFDIIPRTGGPDPRPAPAVPQRREHRRGCGCFLGLLLLLAAVGGSLFILSRVVAGDRPLLGMLLESDGYQNARQAVVGFIDDLMGNPAPSAPPASFGDDSAVISEDLSPLPPSNEEGARFEE